MSLKTILFDLDGTLLPMDQDAFLERYFTELAAKAASCGLDAKAFVRATWHGVMSMQENDGSCLNEAAFFKAFAASYGEDASKYADMLNGFYLNEFERAKVHTTYTPKASNLLKKLRAKGHRLVLATSPLYPRIAVDRRMAWAGIDAEDFEWITTYDTCRFCKPNPTYYTEITDKLGVSPTDCIMVGNDTKDDLPAQEIGMQVVLITDCLINQENVDITPYFHGDFDAVSEYLCSL